MNKFLRHTDGNQWSGILYKVDYLCDNCGKVVENAQVQWEDHEVHEKYKFCPFCGSPIPDDFPVYLKNGKWSDET